MMVWDVILVLNILMWLVSFVFLGSWVGGGAGGGGREGEG